LPPILLVNKCLDKSFLCLTDRRKFRKCRLFWCNYQKSSWRHQEIYREPLACSLPLYQRDWVFVLFIGSFKNL